MDGLRLGIDTGRTNVDVVLMNREGRVMAAAKRPRSGSAMPQAEEGIRQVLDASGIPPGDVAYVMLATSAVADALRDGTELLPVGLIRIGSPATRAIGPLADWPKPLKKMALRAHVALSGGYEYDGRPIGELDREGIARFVRTHLGMIKSLAVVGVFSPAQPRQELEAQEIAHELAPDLSVSLSHELGAMGFFERENATVLNAAVGRVAETAIMDFSRRLGAIGLTNARLYLSQNDGTLMSVAYALRHPIRTVSSSAANAMRGAGWLTGVEDAVVVDVGGERTTIGMIRQGYPRSSHLSATIVGIPTNFPLPDLWTLPWGGGTVIGRTKGKASPPCVAEHLETESLVFGGHTLTLTDAAVSEGVASLGRLPKDFPHLRARRAYAEFRQAVEEGIDRMKNGPSATPVLLVGGGSLLIDGPLAGASEVLRPRYHDVAGAVGAATQEASGRAERIRIEGGEGGGTLDAAIAAAMADAVRAGADPATARVREIEEIPLDYLGSRAERIRVTVSGRLPGVAS